MKKQNTGLNAWNCDLLILEGWYTYINMYNSGFYEVNPNEPLLNEQGVIESVESSRGNFKCFTGIKRMTETLTLTASEQPSLTESTG